MLNKKIDYVCWGGSSSGRASASKSEALSVNSSTTKKYIRNKKMY
jgi:hypothetical protein